MSQERVLRSEIVDMRKKFIRISCGNRAYSHDENEVNEYKRIVVDDQFSDNCQAYGDNCVDCIAYCDNTLLAIEITNEGGLKKHIKAYNGKCKINKRICLDDIGDKVLNVLVLYGASDLSSINSVLSECSNIRYYNVGNNLQGLCDILCNTSRIEDIDTLIIVLFLST